MTIPPACFGLSQCELRLESLLEKPPEQRWKFPLRERGTGAQKATARLFGGGFAT